MNWSGIIKKTIGCLAGAGFLQYRLAGETVIFMFHRVVDENYYRNCTFQKSILVTTSGFIRFLEFVEQNFAIIPLRNLITGQSVIEKSHKPKAVITFDDGWKDNYELAFPILREKGLPATIFLSTDFIGEEIGFWWQGLGELLTDPALLPLYKTEITKYLKTAQIPELLEIDIFNNVDSFIEVLKSRHACRAMEITDDLFELTGRTVGNYSLTWEQCQLMSNYRIDFGSHTLSHPKLTDLDDIPLNEELEKSKALLKKKNIRYINAICYPYGSYDMRTIQFAEKHYLIGLSTSPGIVKNIKKAALLLPRINIPEGVAQSKFWFQYRLLKATITKRQSP